MRLLLALTALATTLLTLPARGATNAVPAGTLVRDGFDRWLLKVPPHPTATPRQHRLFSNNSAAVRLALNAIDTTGGDTQPLKQLYLYTQNDALYVAPDAHTPGQAVSAEVQLTAPYSVERVPGQQPVVAIKSSGATVFLRVESLDRQHVVHQDKGEIASAVSIVGVDSKPRLVLLRKASAKPDVVVKTLSEDDSGSTVTVDLAKTVSAIAPHHASNSFLAVTNDDQVYSVNAQTGKAKFSHDASLANVADALILDLPEAKLWTQDADELDEHGADIHSVSGVTRYLRRWKKHLKELAHLPQSLIAMAEDIIAQQKGGDQSQYLRRGSFGFEKLLVFWTKSGKLVAIDSHTGNTIWTRQITSSGVALKLLNLRSSFVKHPPVIAAAYKTKVSHHRIWTNPRVPDIDGVKLGKKSSVVLHRVNALTGEDLAFEQQSELASHTVALDQHDVAQILPLPFSEPTEKLQCYALISEQHEVQVYPASKQTVELLKSHRDRIHFFNISKQQNKFVGYALPSTSMQGKQSVAAIQAWEFSLPDGAQLLHIAERPAYDKVASLGKVRGDRSVLYKYLNPHVLAFATTNAERNSLDVYLLDTVSGGLLTQAENWVMVHYWNTGGNAGLATVAPLGWTATVLELYESDIPDTRRERPTASSFEAFQPYVAVQSYAFPGEGITATSVATTRNGISLKDLIYAGDEAVASMSRRFLDPLRPTGELTADDKEAGAIPYMPTLPIEPRWTLSRDWTVQGVRKIVSAPTVLESTSMVLAYGQDIFWTKVTPSGEFDLLSEQFAKGTLLSTCLGLFVACLVARSYLTSKQLRAQWK
ncbi:hypothetical protein RI367_005942 [Sorochytrium milnesiophthora]